ncbi:EF-P lysine aminoacylase EpmA [Chromatocurvus halotolerans]|uniref:Lysyl-tRNA synthetase class 2 n=1 Tax=Chromatocurvus halotolerans TaxID=1132028 RepID=A0A4R2KR84_9GAMM|nr:EF-P lysine aminoacylase EpmA [Chromatocurvus halotolerans]TCO76791.1 lysyl-tRNA synthetase class 2 [Chromatocurvus halotolerans]
MNDWRPSADLDVLRQRASLLAAVRAFFDRRGVWEVDTPLLAAHTVTDPALEPLIVQHCGGSERPRYLQTSPEYAMKRLLAAGSGAIYQIAHAFRDDEQGRWHNPEFTLLEWYRPGLDLDGLMTEVADLVLPLLGRQRSQRFRYRDLFRETLSLDPFTATDADLAAAARRCVDTGGMTGGRDLWLDLLMTHAIEPVLAEQGVVFIHDYPASQAALARCRWLDGVEVAARFELYIDGVELANGFHELADAGEQSRRFAADNRVRRERGLPERETDGYLLAALEAGLPDCSGVALGLDRLLMVMCGAPQLSAVMPFDWQRS